MDEDFELLVKALPPHEPRVYPSPDQIAPYEGKLPGLLLRYWQEHGWGAFGQGLFWLVNPAEFTNALQAWCEHVVAIEDAYVIGRSAFGELIVWKKGHGKFMQVVPLEHTIYTYPPNKYVKAGKEDFSLGGFISQIDQDMLDFEDEGEKPLFKRAVKKLGIVAPGEMYAFEPALSLGGTAQLSSLVKVKLEEHLHFLAQLGETQIVHIDTSRFVS
ncbi:MAG: GAD-like domain-containing protein [Pseudomonadota bacterium]